MKKVFICYEEPINKIPDAKFLITLILTVRKSSGKGSEKPAIANSIAAVVIIVILVVAVGALFYVATKPTTTVTATSVSTSTATSTATSVSTSTATSISTATSTATSISTATSVSTSVSTATSVSTSTATVTASTTVPNNGYDFLVFSQKGYAELASPAGTVSGLGSLGYASPYTIPSSTPAQTDYWERYPAQGAAQSNFVVPLNNGTIEVVNGTSLKVAERLSVGTVTGFVGVFISPNEQSAAIVDGPSGVVTVVSLVTLKTLWSQTFLNSAGTTQYPCDIYWSPNGESLAVPMRLNGVIDAINATTGVVSANATVPVAANPVMLTINGAGNMLGVELGNKTDVFYSYPSMKFLGHTNFTPTTFSPTEGVFTPNGLYYVEVSGATNVVEVVSLSNFAVVNTIDLPASASPGLSVINLTPDGDNAYVVMHGTPATGGIIYLLSLATISTATGPSGSIALSTSIGTVIPITSQYATYLEDYVLLPPVAGQQG
jgi:hypothetical protein